MDPVPAHPEATGASQQEGDQPALREDRPAAVVASIAFAALYLYYGLHAAAVVARGKYSDFAYFYKAAVDMRNGQDMYASWHHGFGYLYPPLWAFLITPLASLPIKQAALVQVALNTFAAVAALLLGAREVLRRLNGRPTYTGMMIAALATALILSGPLRAEVEMGQTNAWDLLAVVLALIWVDRRPLPAGLALAFAFNIKLQVIAFLPYLLLRRRWAAAAWFVVGCVLFSLLPAAYMGWSQNLHGLTMAYSQVLAVLGIHVDGGVTAVNPMGVAFSLSVTSTMARLLGPGHEQGALALSMGVLAVCVGVAVAMYRRAGVPVFAWPSARQQRAPRFRAVTAFEWAGILVVALAFSPQTNTRHLVLLSLLVLLGAALFMVAPKQRRLVFIGLLVLFLGISMPPGTRATHGAVLWWRGVGGQSWSILVSFAILLWAGLRFAADRPDSPLKA